MTTATDPLLSLARPELLSLAPYSHAAWEPSLVRLHANEAPWRPAGDTTLAGLNRYPEPQPAALMTALAALYAVPETYVLATRGSDEAIDVLSRLYLRAGVDSILQCTPTFGMYQVAARIQGAGVINVPLDAAGGWSLDVERVLAAWHPGVKLVYLCSPNNPTGNLLELEAIEAVCLALDGRAVVVIDEAYIEWCSQPSLASWLDRFSTVAILRTMSKAYALAGARLGALIARPSLIGLARRILPPYCLAQPTIEAALRALTPEALEAMRTRLAAVLTARAAVAQDLSASPLVRRVFPSDANFLCVDCHDADAFLDRSRRAGLIVRDLRANPALAQSLRVTIGNDAQNTSLLNSLR